MSAHAASLGVAIAPEELAELAVRHDMGTSEIAALNAVFAYLADKRHDQVIETLLRLSRLPQKAPKTFASFDFDRIRAGRGGAAQAAGAREPARAQEPGVHRARRHREDAPGPGLRAGVLPERLQDLLPEGHRAADKLRRAADSGSTSRTVSALVKPSCLIVDEVGRCTFDKVCTDLFFDVVDRRYEKDCANTMILTSNTIYEQLGRVLHRRRHAAVHAGPPVRPSVGVRDEGRQLPRCRT